MTETSTIPSRGGRARGGLEGRGRARGDRGRAGRGGRAGAFTNGTRTEKPAVSTSVNVVETSWAPGPEGGTTAKTEKRIESDTGTDGVKETTTSSVIPEGSKKGWASLFAKPAPPPEKKPAVPVLPTPEKAAETKKAPEPVPVAMPEEKTPDVTVSQPTAPPTAAVSHDPSVADDLTRTNLEQIPDVSAPAPTATTASTMGSLHDQNNMAAGTSSRAAPSAYASALKQNARAPGFQRRVMEQQEAVVMPGNHAVDRTAVQFGSMGLNGDPADADIDKNREQAETRAQPPQHSPVAPRASFPPSTQPQASTETPAVSRPAPGLPPVSQVSAADSFTDFGSYTDAQKPYDPFNQQPTQPQPQIHEPFASQAPTQTTASTGSEYSPFYAVDQRLPYNYYGSYGQSQDAGLAQRAAAGFGVTGADAQPQIPSTQPPSRYGHVEAPNSGHTTPNPTLPGATQAPTAQHMPTQAHGYNYGYPYYSNPQYASYMTQMANHQYGRNRPMYDDARRYEDHYMPHSSQFYGNQYGPYGKGGMYGQPHAFSYDHSSPATGFNQAMPARDSVYGRTGSAQPSESQQSATGANAFGGGMTDVFGRAPAGFGPNQQQPVTAEETKSFDTPKAGGPSPSLAHANRPGSATNTVPGQPQAQPGLPPLQGQQGQQAFGGYGHLNPQYSGLGGLGGNQAQSHHQANPYANYGGAGFSNYYGNTRGGWGGNYGH